MRQAYTELHKLGYAHSVEVWENNALVGGLYGISLGACFFGESMFSLTANASKTALICLTWHLIDCGFHFIDCQIHNPHLESLGAENITRACYMEMLQKALKEKTLQGDWALFFPHFPYSSSYPKQKSK
jgi:leucyl/phenylalanyl-tRNA--protein transferase